MARRLAKVACAALGAWVVTVGSAAAAESGEAPVSPRTGLSIGIAPFVRVAEPGASVPDVATLLANRLATKGVERVVGPASLGTPASGEPSAEEILAWAARDDLDAVVVGKATKLVRSLSIDVRLRSGEHGEVVETYVEEIARPEQLGDAVERLSDELLEDIDRVLPGSSARPPDSSAAGATDAGRSPFRSDAPVKISAAQLEAFEKEGRKRLVFTEDVQASQGDLSLRSERLEAFYPKDSSQPERLVASGGVVVAQQDRTARCSEATYVRDDQLVVCTGTPATLVQGDDQVQGRRIVFHLDTEVLTVEGSVELEIQPKQEGEAPEPGEASPP